MDKLLYREDLNAVVLNGCSSPGCDRKAHDVLYLHCGCDLGGTLEVSYQLGSGILTIGCMDCCKPMARIAVAQNEKVEREGTVKHWANWPSSAETVFMNDELHRVDQMAADAIVPGSLVQQLNAENAGYEELVKQSKDRIEKCGDLLRQAKSAVPEDEWGRWLGANFDGSVERARLYMEYGSDSEASEVNDEYQTEVIPPPGKSLRFSSNDIEGGTALCIEPAYREGYYYVTSVGWQHEHELCSSFTDGPREPVLSDEIWKTCQRLQCDYLVEGGERTESASTPLAFNRWQFEGHVQQRQPDADQQPQTEQGSERECSTDKLSEDGGTTHD